MSTIANLNLRWSRYVRRNTSRFHSPYNIFSSFPSTPSNHSYFTENRSTKKSKINLHIYVEKSITKLWFLNSVFTFLRFPFSGSLAILYSLLEPPSHSPLQINYYLRKRILFLWQFMRCSLLIPSPHVRWNKTHFDVHVYYCICKPFQGHFMIHFWRRRYRYRHREDSSVRESSFECFSRVYNRLWYTYMYNVYIYS